MSETETAETMADRVAASAANIRFKHPMEAEDYELLAETEPLRKLTEQELVDTFLRFDETGGPITFQSMLSDFGPEGDYIELDAEDWRNTRQVGIATDGEWADDLQVILARLPLMVDELRRLRAAEAQKGGPQ